MQKALLFAVIWISTTSVAVTNEQIAVLRQEMDQTPLKEQQMHLTTTLEALRRFAANKSLPDPISNEPVQTDVWNTWDQTCRFAFAYGVIPASRLSMDPNDPSSRQVRLMMSQTAELLNDSEKAMITYYIDEQIKPLQSELAKEMAKPTATYITVGGVQKEAVTEKALQLSRMIQGIKSSGPLLRAEIHPLYRDSRAEVICKMQNCDISQARRVNDVSLQQLWELHEKKREAAERKGQSRQSDKAIDMRRSTRPQRSSP